MPEFTIATYKPEYRSAVFGIAADTAFFGDPVEAYLEDRHLFCDIFYRYYTDYEMDHSWVSIAGQEVIGFLMGCTDTAAQQRRWLRVILPSTLWWALRGRYRLGRRTWRYTAGLVKATINREFVHCDLEEYPAHLHVNIAEKGRGLGIGRQLMETYLGHLRQLGVPGVHLHTTSLNEAACRLYNRLGFDLLDSRRTGLWQSFLEQEVENHCYGLKLIGHSTKDSREQQALPSTS
jgi:ribosomal protein S18 acetylase RimI-like enzyme